NGCHLLVRERQRRDRVAGTLGDTEQQRLAIRRPRLRNMGRVLVRLRQALRRRRAVSALPEEAEIPVAVRLKRHALAVRGPDGHTIAASQRESARRLTL